MDQLLKNGGVEPENRARVGQIVETMKRFAECKSFDVVNVAESPEMVLKLYSSARRLSARISLANIALKCAGVRDATVMFARSGLDEPLEIHVKVLKDGRPGVGRYQPPQDEKIYLVQRLREVAGDVKMPRRLFVAIQTVARSVISYSKAELGVRFTYASGTSRCAVTFVGMRECSLSFLEYIFERCGRSLVDVELLSEGLERRLIATLDIGVKLPDFPSRREDRTQAEANKRARVVSSTISQGDE